MLVVMGEGWTNYEHANDGHLLNDPKNPVRETIEYGLKTPNVKVIPVLIDSIELPDPQSLPKTLQNLAKQEAFTVHTDQRFDQDMNRLIETLEGQRRLSLRGVTLVTVILAAIVGFAILALIAGSI